MTWCGGSVPDGSATSRSEMIQDNITTLQVSSDQQLPPVLVPKSNDAAKEVKSRKISCPSCGRHVEIHDQGGGFIQELPGLPAGVKFDPTDQEIVQHLEAKVVALHKLHPLIDEFIPTLEGENGICYTHPEKLPGVGKDGLIRHFFHRPSKAYTTGTRKRRKVSTDDEGGETRWHKTGKTRPVFINGEVKGYKKILVLYTNYGRQRKPEKTNWVMHQYHIGSNEEEKDGELVVSKVFYQTQPRQCGGGGSVVKDINHSFMIEQPSANQHADMLLKNTNVGYVEFYGNDAHHQQHHDHHQLMRYGGSMGQ